MKKTILLFSLLVLFSFKSKAQTVTDIDGNVYTIVTIGTQQWLGENLKVIHYRNGDLIPNVSDNTAWINLLTGAYCNYNNDTNNTAIYGRLYNFHAAVDNRNIAPTGWHVPTKAEWDTLVNYLGGGNIAGGKLKEIGTEHWESPNTGATNESGFSALPGGMRSGAEINPSFGDIGKSGYFWSATQTRYRELYYLNTEARPDFWDNEEGGMSVRCVKDNTIGVYFENNPNKIRIYPNPAIDKINIDFSNLNQFCIVTIYDLSGKIIVQKQIKQLQNEINISSLINGIYIIEISDAQFISQKKLIKR
jgi:uncharacterized protein (TIGR02145 family)